MSPPAKGPSKAAAGGSGVMAIESDLVRLIGALAARPAKLLRSGLPGKRDYRSFNKNLINPNEIGDAKRMEDTGRLLFIYELAYRLDLLTERDGMVTCDLRAAEEFFAQDPTSRIRRMLSAYNGMVLWEEFSYTEGLLIVPEEGEPVNDDPVPSAARLVLARKLVIEALGKFARAKPRPFALRTVIGNIKKEGFRLVGADDDARRPPPKKGADDGAYRSIRVSGPLGAFRRAIWPGDWDLVEGALLETICRESLVWLGLAEQVDEKRFRLSPAGRTILGDGSDLPEEVTSKSLVVQPNFELLLFPEGRTPATMFAVERFARPGEEEGQVLTYRITRESVYGAVKDGMGIDQLLSFLEARASSALPQNVRRTLSTWASQFDRVVLMKGCLLVEGGTAKELDAQLKRLKGLRTERVTPTMVMVSPVDAAEAHKRLERKSCVVLDLSGPPPACITVSGELVIELDPMATDLCTVAHLDRLAEPEDGWRADLPTYRVTADSLERARELGIEPEDAVAWLEARSRGPLPSQARLRLDAITGAIKAPFVGWIPVMMAESQGELDRLLREVGLETKVSARTGPATAVLKEGSVEDVEEALADLGLGPSDSPPTGRGVRWGKTRSKGK